MAFLHDSEEVSFKAINMIASSATSRGRGRPCTISPTNTQVDAEPNLAYELTRLIRAVIPTILEEQLNNSSRRTPVTKKHGSYKDFTVLANLREVALVAEREYGGKKDENKNKKLKWDEGKPYATSGKSHGDKKCLANINACFTCRKVDHKARDCNSKEHKHYICRDPRHLAPVCPHKNSPKGELLIKALLVQTPLKGNNQTHKVTSRVFQMTSQYAKETNDVVTGKANVVADALSRKDRVYAIMIKLCKNQVHPNLLDQVKEVVYAFVDDSGSWMRGHVTEIMQLTRFIKRSLTVGRFSMMETISMMKILLLESIEVMKNCSSHVVTGHKTIHLNIYMKSLAKVIYLILGQHLRSKPVLPYLSPAVTDKNLPLGANFASAGIGILNDTGFQFAMTGHRAMMKHQIEEKDERKLHHHTTNANLNKGPGISEYVWKDVTMLNATLLETRAN
nr:GDSL esterase/lipase At5g33370-like [Tanacetum cinerariifolium]